MSLETGVTVTPHDSRQHTLNITLHTSTHNIMLDMDDITYMESHACPGQPSSPGPHVITLDYTREPSTSWT